ncbi:MAG: UvrD-helicase domain-containing protein [Chloroflexi bacterium]|nr:UvrD-helicase domain-containing protein [Chloroflexota bacterium]
MTLFSNHDYSPRQQQAILAREHKVVVTAGAGTGKTHTLVGRYLYLLQNGLPLRSIVAITFTRKAAREMRNRTRQAVWCTLAGLDVADPAYQHWQSLFTELDAARIDTIHGFCSQILRSHPVEAEIEPGFEMLDETMMVLLQQQAVEEALGWAAKQDHAAALFASLGEWSLRGALKTVLARRLDAEVALRGEDEPQALLATWQAELQTAQARARQNLINSPEWQQCYRHLHETIPLDPSDKLATQRDAALQAMARFIDEDADDISTAVAIFQNFNLRSGSSKKWPGGKETVDAVKADLKWLRETVKAQPVFGMVLGPQDEAWAQLLPVFRQVANVAVQSYAGFKRQRRALDFDDLEAKALVLLQKNAHVRRYWQEEVQALLVDEFQDTNQRQRQLIELVQGEDTTLFVVGDAKQSIYRFRGADVTVFRQERAAAQEKGGVISLDESYRAHAALVAMQNAALAPVLGDASDNRPDWEEPFAPLRAVHERPQKLDQPPFIELYLAVGSKREGALQRSAAAVAGRLADWFQTQAYAADDVALLCRAASSFAAYENALEQAGIPFVTLAGRGFYDRPEVRELLVLLRAAADAEDAVALVGALRSAPIGLSDMALLQLVRDARQHEEATLWPALGRYETLLDAAEGPQVRFGVALLTEMRALAGRVTVAELLATLLDRSDYLALLAATGQSRAQRNVSKLLTDAQTSGLVQVSDFLAYVAAAKGAQVKEGEAPVLSQGAVQIMTVHKAKGMEFPVVVMGNLGYSHNRTPTFLLADDHLLLNLPDNDQQAPAMFELYRQQEKRKDEAELKRLLYVAATRAQERLLLSGTVKLSKDGLTLSGWAKELLPHLGLDDAALPQFDLSGSRMIELAWQCGGQPVACWIAEPGWTPDASTIPDVVPTPASQQRPTGLVQPVSSLHVRRDDDTEEEDRDPPRRVWRVTAGDGALHVPAWVVGKLVHHAIQYWRFPGDQAFDAWLTAYARSLGMVEPRQLRQALQQASRMLGRLQASALGREIAAAELRQHEVPYVLARPDGVERGVIDLLYRRSGQWTLVDFKTNRLRDEAAARALLADPHNDYEQQVRRYAAAMSALLDVQPRAAICFLNVGGGVWKWGVE